ncbi:xanthine dehydrogenase accessory factor [Parafrankia irregularis]|uniref:Xanthine dehydrogenase accessory factor n=1 Tax=Parafrankia irregularis TaxID=795642 RepID=A0A0S4QI98_9ACTN|nr:MULTISPECIES: XdhC/CoxI family protein [Parafrankia]CUU55301.1 xanthine dehydrogenase accessory factor [Parafrankia irregularis]
MHDLVQVLAADCEASDVVLARPVAARGIGVRSEGETLAVTADGSVLGELLGGAIDGPVRGAAASLIASSDTARVVPMHLPHGDAREAGLSCGGHVDVLLQRASALPAAAVERLRAGCLVALVTDLASGRSRAVEPGKPVRAPASVSVSVPASVSASVPAQAQPPDEEGGFADTVRRLLLAGRTAAAVEGATVVELFVPTTHLVLLGAGALAEAIAAQARLLGWRATTVGVAATGVGAVERLGPSGGLVAFAHDAAVDDPVLIAALRAGVGYVGALGSRRTHALRLERLRAAGVDDGDLARIHGPVGLDLGARTVTEIALAISAEALAVLTRRTPTPLRDGAGPIHR